MNRQALYAAACASLLAMLCASAHAARQPTADVGWPYYGGDAQGTRYTALTQITPANVSQLQRAWTFHTGDLATGTAGPLKSGFETMPLVLAGRLFPTTPFNRIIALYPGTGRPLWSYDPHINRHQPYGDGLTNRGLAAWQDPRAPAHCALRLFEATLDARLVAVDAKTGRPCADFGTHGEVDLTGIAAYRPGWYHMTSPPIVVDGVVTASGLIFVAGTMDRRFHALSSATGEELWHADLPASAHATPITYEYQGTQCVVIAAGAAAHIDEERRGDALIAFALPKSVD